MSQCKICRCSIFSPLFSYIRTYVLFMQEEISGRWDCLFFCDSACDILYFVPRRTTCCTGGRKRCVDGISLRRSSAKKFVKLLKQFSVSTEARAGQPVRAARPTMRRC